ncbi:MAG: hypothetical protein A2Y25_01750 [Candidatus Melainabacteria bacterium GWF2_37_15]|nr:MAG: hypothetical protein A2Y25_01750 [Candidatus Melainabacteria bacterium GWF2_37_15]
MLDSVQAQNQQNIIKEGRAEIQLRLLLLDLMSDAQKAKDPGTRESIIAKIQSLAEPSGKSAEQVTGTKIPDASSIFKNNQPTLSKTINLSGGVKQAAAAPKATAADTDTVEIGKTDAAAGKKGVSAASGDIIGGELGSGDIAALNTETYSQMSSELQSEISRIMDEGGGAGNGATFKDIAEKLNASGYEAEWTHINDASDGQGNVTVTDKDGKTFRLHEANGDGTLNANEIDLNGSLANFKSDLNKTDGTKTAGETEGVKTDSKNSKVEQAINSQDVSVIKTRQDARKYLEETGKVPWNIDECPACRGAGCELCSADVPKTGVMGGVGADFMKEGEIPEIAGYGAKQAGLVAQKEATVEKAEEVKDVSVITTREEAYEYQQQTGRQAWNKAECPLCKGAGCGYCSDSVPKTGVMGGVLGSGDSAQANNAGETNVNKTENIAKPSTIQKAQQLTAQNPLLEQFPGFNDLTDQVSQPFSLGESSLQSLIQRILEMLTGYSNN